VFDPQKRQFCFVSDANILLTYYHVHRSIMARNWKYSMDCRARESLCVLVSGLVRVFVLQTLTFAEAWSDGQELCLATLYHGCSTLPALDAR
jgi:hypothetical protein